ncbi:uncharacterized protein LOC115411174 [Sphaeramia orbicularis]|uniref:uncharacterized protein LOC115411174 n=1 Tax=Sphaeramia orbicularis TaxID=375764 RepID=UPI00117E1798|nr:uncharacterized protein LOC115411174 [Sphaeramia orbicularis]
MVFPVEEPKPLTPVVRPKTPAPQHATPQPPPREPSPELPAFLKEFADTDWFKDLYPDDKSVLTTLSPDDFSLQLLAYFNTCAATAPSRITILAALQTLHMHGLIQKIDKLHQDLIDSVPRAVKPHMSPYEQAVLGQMLHLMTCLKPAGSKLVINLLTLLAYKNLGLRGRILRMITALGVDEAEQWLWPELESWESELPNQCDVWKSLHNRAENWLEIWTSKYKDCKRYLFLKRTEDRKPASFSVVDVLNYFCSVQKEAKRTAPARVRNTVLLPLYDCVSHPIHRLGETYSMARIRKPQGLILPPLRNRPSLMHFPKFISLPLPHITLSPFHIYSDEDWLKAPYRRYFIQQQSHVEYYR